MTRLALALVLLSLPALADQMGGSSNDGYAVLTTPVQVFTPSASNAGTMTLKVINRGADTIYCAPLSTVTTNTGDPIASGASAAYPAVPVWCITTVNQTKTGTSRTLVWETTS
jgi:hypothetical protein